MQINPEILEYLTEYKFQKDDAICYLISLYYGYKPTYIPDDFKVRLNTLKIYEEDKGTLKWNIPLFEGQQTAFEWVKTEFVPLFKEANPLKGGHVREATTRLKKLFAKNPDIRKDDIIGATKMYIKNTDSRYVMFPHYFITKGDGADRTETIMSWIEKYQLSLEIIAKSSVTNTMQ